MGLWLGCVLSLWLRVGAGVMSRGRFAGVSPDDAGFVGLGVWGGLCGEEEGEQEEQQRSVFSICPFFIISSRPTD